MANDLPGDEAMAVLDALCNAIDIGPSDCGEVVIERPSETDWRGYEEVVLTIAVQEELIARGWLTLEAPDADGSPVVVVTGEGRRANGDWLRARAARAARAAQNKPPRVAAVRRRMFGRKRAR